MAVIEVTPGPKRPATLSLFKREYTVIYTVRTDDPLDGPRTVAGAIPFTYGDPYSIGNDSDSEATLKKIVPSLKGDSLTAWQCNLSFDTEPLFPEGVSGGVTTPFDEPADVEWEFNPRQIGVSKDRHGNRIRNSAGMPFDEIVTKDVTFPILNVSRYEASFPFGIAEMVADRVNSLTWQGFAPRTMKVHSIRAQRMYHVAWGRYYRITYGFAFNRLTWNYKPLDQGYHELIAGEISPIKKDGFQITDPLPLDGAGRLLAQGGQEIYLDFEIQDEINFDTVFGFIFA